MYSIIMGSKKLKRVNKETPTMGEKVRCQKVENKTPPTTSTARKVKEHYQIINPFQKKMGRKWDVKWKKGGVGTVKIVVFVTKRPCGERVVEGGGCNLFPWEGWGGGGWNHPCTVTRVL